MEPTAKIEVVEREKVGTRESRRLRKKGRLPINLYGLGRPVRALHMDAHTMQQIVSRGGQIVELTLNDKTQPALMKDFQYDALGQTLQHIDLERIDATHAVHVHIPIRYIGTAPAVAGSIVEKQMDFVPLEILPLEIPREFVINLSKLEVGSHVSLGDLTLPGSGKLWDAHEEDVVVVNHVFREREVEAEEGETPAEPEVIARGKGEEGGGED